MSVQHTLRGLFGFLRKKIPEHIGSQKMSFVNLKNVNVCSNPWTSIPHNKPGMNVIYSNNTVIDSIMIKRSALEFICSCGHINIWKVTQNGK